MNTLEIPNIEVSWEIKMNLEINWSEIFVIQQNNRTLYARDWNIPIQHRTEFFNYWKLKKAEMTKNGYSVYKKNLDWFLREVKSEVSLFKDTKKKSIPKKSVITLEEYKLKNSNGLRPWQTTATSKLVASIKHWGCSIDGSDTGVGKTYTACAVAREMNYKIFVVCPKAVKESWRRVIYDHFDMGSECVGIENYEILKNGNTDFLKNKINRKNYRREYNWKIPKKTLIIWDEAQKLKNHKTQNSKMCMSAFNDGYKMLFCSATLATNPIELKTVGRCLQLFTGERKFYDWAYDHGVIKGRFGLEFTGDPESLKKIHNDIFSNRGVRLNRDAIPNFPDSQIIVDCYDLDKENTKKINDVYDEMQLELLRLEKRSSKNKKEKTNKLVSILRARQKIELLKIPLLIEMANEGVEDGMSIVIFCNFTETINALSQRLKTKCILDGNVKNNIRQKNIDDFQSDKERIILVNVAAGGAGVSLHDLNGNYPRLSIISPSYSAVLMRQSTGRVWRDGAKTKSLQKIVFVNGTVEEKVCEIVNQKLNNLDLLNDGDLSNIKNYEE